MKRFFIFLLVLSIYPVSNAQVLNPIDSLYLNNVAVFARTIDRLKENVWPGMQVGPYCIFRLGGPAVLLNHPAPPRNSRHLKDSIYVFNASDYNLTGATQTEINGLLTAYNDYSNKSYTTVNQFYSELFHELHHVYQRNYIKNLRFDNPADLLTYPEDYRNDAVKLYEYGLWLELLTDAQNHFAENIDKIFTCRNIREEIIGSKYIEYEKAVESVEGPATFCEYEYMQQFSSVPREQEYIHHRFYYSLTEPVYGRDALRSKHLLTGMIQCLLLSKHYANWQHEYYTSGLNLYDYFISKYKPAATDLPDLSIYEAKAKYFTTLEKAKHPVNLENFNSQNGVKVRLMFRQTPECRGFDPMHAEAINDSLILHYTLLNLTKAKNHFSSINHITLSAFEKQIWSVKSVTFFIKENDLKIEDCRVRCFNGTLDIDWGISGIIRKGNEYLIKAE